MLKKYQSKSCVSLSVLMENGNSVHVSFNALTGGGSVFYTDNEDLQKALSNHAKFGKLFKEVVISKMETTEDDGDAGDGGDARENGDAGKTGDSRDSGEDGESGDGGGDADSMEAEHSGGKEIHVSCLEDAKNYLAENLGISRTKLRSQKAILEAAAENGITFVGLKE